jgi:hypothetical protein
MIKILMTVLVIAAVIAIAPLSQTAKSAVQLDQIKTDSSRVVKTPPNPNCAWFREGVVSEPNCAWFREGVTAR